MKAKPSSSQRGSIIGTLVVFMTGLIALAALCLDFAMMTSYKRSVQNVAEMMAIAAMGYHTDENFDKTISGLTLNQQHQAKAALGLRNAYFVWQSTISSLADSDKFVDPFGGVNWSTQYENMMTDLTNGGTYTWTFPDGSYASSNIRFLEKGGANYVEPSGLFKNVADPLIIRATKNEINTTGTGSGLTTILAHYFGFKNFMVKGSTLAEVNNTGKANSVVLLLDRSISMAGMSGDAGYLQPGDANYDPRYPGLSVFDLSAMTNTAATIQPITNMLYAARLVPKTLGRANWFNDNPAKNSSLGFVAFDLVAESVDAPPTNFDLDFNTCAGCDNYNNAYKTIKDRMNAHIPVMGRPGLPQINLCADVGCRDCNTAGCASTCNPLFNNIFYAASEAKCIVDVFGNTARPEPSTELDSMFPWTASNESQGLEVAVELIRQERKRFFDTFNGPNFDIDSEFQGQIILFSDGFVEAFHDRNATLDAFPQKCNSGGCTLCDSLLTVTHNIREFAPPLDPGPGNPVYQMEIIPAGWRKDFNSSGEPRVTWATTVCPSLETFGPCLELYHDGAALYKNQLPAGKQWFGPNDPPQPVPEGLYNVSTVDISLALATPRAAGGRCPGTDCAGAIVAHEHQDTADTVRRPSINLYCPDLHFMDHVDWAYANNIIINTVGFGDIGTAYNPSAPNNNMRRQFLLRYATAPNNYDQDASNNTATDKGFFLTSADANCNAAGTGCPKFESALKRAFTSFEARLK
ncbi:MAG: hypothetical protein HY587_06090 [Candidatus Omnitrophica bacterium]|nr:hypothetical protein [Candidatus Omnitrophota bacterium]